MSDPDHQQLFGKETKNSFVVVIITAEINPRFKGEENTEKPLALSMEQCFRSHKQIADVTGIAGDHFLKDRIIIGV